MANRRSATGIGGFRLETALGARLAGPAGAPARHTDDLQICPCCGRDLVHPTDWAPARDGHWRVALRCPECEWRGGGVYDQGVVDRFDETLDDGTQAVLEDLELLRRANVEEEIESFARALERGLILPEDF